MTPRAQTVEGNIGNSDFIKIKNVLRFRGHCQESVKTTHRMGENIFVNHICDKVLVSRIHKEL